MDGASSEVLPFWLRNMPDGFAAIRFAGYEESDLHNRLGGLKETLHHPEAERQKRKLVCPLD